MDRVARFFMAVVIIYALWGVLDACHKDPCQSTAAPGVQCSK